MLMRLQHADYGLPNSQARTQLSSKHLAALDGSHPQARLDGAESKECGRCGRMCWIVNRHIRKCEEECRERTQQGIGLAGGYRPLLALAAQLPLPSPRR